MSNVSFAYDGADVFFPVAPGRVFSISFSTLAACELLSGDELVDHFEATTEITDVAGMLTTTEGAEAIEVARNLTPLAGDERKPPRPWVDAGGEGDFGDMLDAWASWCEARSLDLDRSEAAEAA